ncbi:MAG: helix-turn-helix transcriptional regulator [Opitutaceae bacterium]|nr:helix-turn-helix transcriptional regulator [Opitutaceae bacterium]
MKTRCHAADWAKTPRCAMPQIENNFPAVTVNPSRPYDSIRELYLYEEPALLASLHRGDRREAMRIINLVLVHIYSAGHERSEMLKILLLELVVMMSRGAVEAGAPQSEVIGFCYRHITELIAITDDEQLAHWLREALLRIFDEVERVRATRLPANVQKALDAIRAAPAGTGLETVRRAAARAAGVPPRQLTQLLKARTGRSFSDLVREARIEHACELLAKTEQPVAVIATDCGFCDQSYFTKVFQKMKKTTPRLYREAAQGRMR